MSKPTRILALALFLTAFLVAGCDVNESFVDGYDRDPNLPTDAPATKVFIAGQVSSIVVHEGYASRIANMWTQHFVGNENQYENIYEDYGVTTQDFGGIWFDVYVRTLANLKVTQRKAAQLEGQQNLVAIAKINEAMLMGTVTALWGNVPYSEAAAEPPNEAAAFDDQSFVYEQVITKLDEAIATLEGDARNLPEGVDVLSYDGNAERWLRAAYTLKARFHLHQGNLPEAIEAAGDGITDASGAGDLGIPHGIVTDENANLWSAFTSDRGWLQGEGARSVELMNERTNRGAKTDESGRLSFYFDTGTSELLPNLGDDGGFEADDTYPLVTFSENMLIMAEAFARRGDTGPALNALNAVRDYNESAFGGTFEPLQASDFEPGGDLENSSVLREVLDEAYLSYISQIEAFNLVRRVDDYDFGLTPNGEGQFPERFLYAEEELNGNPNAPDPIPGLFDPTPVNR